MGCYMFVLFHSAKPRDLSSVGLRGWPQLTHVVAAGVTRSRRGHGAREVCVLRADLPFLAPAGHANASFCPHGYGCRAVVVCEGQSVLDVTDSELTVTVRVPEGRWLWLVSPEVGVPACGHPGSAQGPAVLTPVTPPSATQSGCLPSHTRGQEPRCCSLTPWALLVRVAFLQGVEPTGMVGGTQHAGHLLIGAVSSHSPRLW